MAFQAINGIVIPPIPYDTSALSFLTSTFVIDAADEKVAIICQAPKTGSIRKVIWRTGTVTTGATLDVRIETVSTSTGMPTGTLWGTNTNGSQVVSAGSTVYETQLTSDASVTKNDIIAIVIANPSVSFGNMQIVSLAGYSNTGNFPYMATYTSSWSGYSGTYQLVFLLEYSDGSYAYQPHNSFASSITSTTFSSSTNPNHRALRFRLPCKVRVGGLWAQADMDGDMDLLLVADNWDGTNGNALARVVLDKDIRYGTSARAGRYMLTSSVELAADTTYRVVIKPTTTTSLTSYHYSLGSNAQFAVTEMGIEAYLSTANNPTGSESWTDTTTARIMAGLILDGFDDGASAGGGLLTHPGMAGGMRG
jgi:hypothetical protein